MPKPFANSQPITPSLISGDWLLGIQTGNSTGDNGLPQMKYIRLSQLTDWVRSNYGEIWRYRGPFSASLPSDPQANDYFLATATFTVGADTYTKDHLYAYSTSGTWDDISDVLTQYASQAQVTDIDDRLGVIEDKVDAMGDGIVYKGKVATYADLAGIADPQKGWEYYVTGDAAFYIYNGSSWDPIDNGIVQTITDGDISHAPSADAVYDALASEATARQNAVAHEASVRSAQVSALSKRVTNLELKTGDQFDVNYPSDTYGTDGVPAGVEPYAKVKTLIAKSRAWNQLLNASNVIISSGTIGGATLTNNTDGSITLNGTTTGNDSKALTGYMSITAGHKYLIFGAYSSNMRISVYANNGSVYVGLDEGSGLVFEAGTYTNMNFRLVFDCLASGQYFSNVKHYILIRDLTPIFPDLPSTDLVTSNIPNLVKRCPDLLKPDAYGTSMVNETVEGVESIGFNRWDEDWEIGDISGSDGTFSPSGDYICSKNLIKVNPSETYCISSTHNQGNASRQYIIYKYGCDGSFLGYISLQNQTDTFKTDANCFFVKFRNNITSITYNHDICINVSSSENGTYKPYMTSTLSLPTPFAGKSAGSVADTDELNVEVIVDGQKVNKRRQTTRVGSYTFTGSENWQTYGGSNFYANVGLSARQYSGSEIPNITSNTGFNPVSRDVMYTGGTGICVDGNEVYVSDTSNITGKTINFELATESVIPLDPIEDNFIKVEPNGTVRTIQSQTPEIDSAMSVEYMAS